MNSNTTPTRGAAARSLYRTILSLGVAALIAASIPFAAIYVSTLQRPPALAALARGASGVKLVTTASGRQIAVPASGSGSTAAALTTHSSGSAGGGND